MNLNDKLNLIEIVPLLDTLKLEKIEDEEYFSAKYSNYISNSRLSLINPLQDNDPKAFFEGLSKHNKYSDALIFGSAVHELVLQPELFKMVNHINRPTAKMGFMADELYKNYLDNNLGDNAVIEASNKINYYKGKMNDEKIRAVIDASTEYWDSRKEFESNNLSFTPIYLDSKSRERVVECVKALQSNATIQSLLNPTGILQNPISENEQAILLDIQVTVPNFDPFILKLKSKLDNYTIDLETNTVTVNDIKTIGKILSEFSNNFEKFHYYRELSMYCWLMSLVVKKYYNMDNCSILSNCLVVSTIPKYYTKVYEVTKGDFIKGWEEFKYLIRLVAYYCTKGYSFYE